MRLGINKAHFTRLYNISIFIIVMLIFRGFKLSIMIRAYYYRLYYELFLGCSPAKVVRNPGDLLF